MKIEDAEMPNYKIAIKKLQEHSDEVFTVKEGKEKFGKGIGIGMKYAYGKSDEIDRISLGGNKSFYGISEAIEKLKERLDLNED